MSPTNFLIGRGELLTHDVKGPGGSGPKGEAYTLQEAIKRLLPEVEATVSAMDALPLDLCPGDFGVAKLILNPSYIAKSYFPMALLRAAGLESIGSRGTSITPQKWTRKKRPAESGTTEIFVAGKRSAFRSLPGFIKGLEEDSDEAVDLARIEKVAEFTQEERFKDYGPEENRFFEVGLHLLPDEYAEFVSDAFTRFAGTLGISVHSKLSFRAGNLWFVPVEADREKAIQLSSFSFVRVVRPVPKLRGLKPLSRTSMADIGCKLPIEQPLSNEPRVAILDGGLPKDHPIGTWLRAYRELDSKASDDSDALEHGLGVTSAFLFGPIEPGQNCQRPFSYVDHLRVLDSQTGTEDPLELYRTLGLIEEVLLSRQYEFINLSLGPDLPIEDTDVHAWTSVIDDLLSDGNTFMTIAVGNNGARDRASGNARVQVPSDCVNATAVGAANHTESSWSRAAYSAVGPGRSPGLIKPDLMAFGGDHKNYFHVLAPGSKPQLAPQCGTSLAAPYLLRSAVGIRAILGTDLSLLSVKALMVHDADPSTHDKTEVGWGKIPEDLLRTITCPAGVARVIYKGHLKPGKYLRARLPLPDGGLKGRIQITATFCYACPTDPQDASSYTQAGLDVFFRPHAEKVKGEKNTVKTRSFFQRKTYSTEEEMRSDFGKWETVLNDSVRMNGSSLNDPAFDIHYNAREGGGRTARAERIPYALVLTVKAPKHPNLFNDILRAYTNILQPIQPHVSLPIRL